MKNPVAHSVLLAVVALILGLAVSVRREEPAQATRPATKGAPEPSVAQEVVDALPALRVEKRPWISASPTPIAAPSLELLRARRLQRTSPSSPAIDGGEGPSVVRGAKADDTEPVAGANLPRLPEPIQISRREVIKELEGGFAYNAEKYGVTLHSSGVTFGTGASLKDLDNPMLAYSFEELRVGQTVVASAEPIIPRVVPEERAVSYARGQVEERYLLKKDALEQVFVLRELPQGPGAITVTGSVQTNLTPPAEGTAAGKLIFSHAGQEIITISEAIAIDASGRRLELDLAYADGRMSLTVPAAWVADAKLPITIDPLIGSSFTIDASAQNPTNASIAYSSTSNEWFVVWKEQVGAGTNQNDILGQRISASGTLVGSAFSIVGSVSDVYWPTVSWASSVNRYLVSWSGPDGGSSYNTFGRVVNANGTFFTGTFTLGSDTALDTRPWAAFDGTNWYVAWANILLAFPNQYRILGRFVSTSGTPGTQANPDTDLVTADNPRVDFTSGTYMIFWRKANSGATLWGAAARTMTTTGSFPTAITWVEASNTGVSGNEVSAGSGLFLVSWALLGPPNEKLLKARISNTSLGWQTSEVNISSATVSVLGVSAAYSSTVNHWYVAYDDPNAGGEVYGRRLTTSGIFSGAPEQVTATPATSQAPQVKWNSATNEALVTFFEGSGPTYQLLAQRVSLPGPPAAPTGLSATGLNARVSLAWNASATATGYFVWRSTTSGGPYGLVGNPTAPSFVDQVGIENGVTYFYVVSAENSGGVSGYSGQASATPAAPSSIPALFVVGNVTLSASDNAIKTRLENLGYGLTIKSASASTTADAAGKALVFISASVSPSGVNTKFRDVLVPVICCEHGLYDDMGMTTSPTSQHGSQSGQTQLAIVDSAHPMAAGFSPGNLTVLTTGRSFTWGKPSTSAARIATLVSDSTKWVIFGYETGATMPVTPPGVAPARRVGFFLESATAQSLNANGDALFNAAVRWATNAPPSAPISTLMPSSGQVTILWDPVPGALSYTIRRATSQTGPFTTIASGLTGGTYVDTGLTNGTEYWYEIRADNDGGTFATPAMPVAPQAVTYLIGIKGPAFLRRKLAGDPADTWNTGTLEASVKETVGGPEVPAGAIQLAGAWQVTSLPPQSVILLNSAPKLTEVQSTPNIGFSVLKYNAVNTTDPNKKGSITFIVESTKRMRMNVRIRFPKDGPGKQTARPYDFFNPVLATRQAERTRFITDNFDNVITYWKQASIDLYVLPDLDNNLFLGVGSYDAANRFVVSANGGITTIKTFLDVYTNGTNFHETINIYLVNQIWDGMALNGGYTLGTGLEGDIKHTVMLADTGNERTIAHEMGHALRLRDLTAAGQITGNLNNYIPTVGWPAALDILLMKHVGDTNARWLTTGNARDARDEAKISSALESQDP